ncbi:MAG: NUDIX hydrolase [Actinomycetes bacterium]
MKPNEVTRVAAYGLCVDAGGLLLARLSAVTQTPGHWTLPGGGIDHGEHPREAVLRELYEETGLRGRPTALLGVDSFQRSTSVDDGVESYHAVRVLYRVQVESTGPLEIIDVGGSTDDVAWVALDKVSEVPLTPVARWALTLIDSAGAPA